MQRRGMDMPDIRPGAPTEGVLNQFPPIARLPGRAPARHVLLPLAHGGNALLLGLLCCGGELLARWLWPWKDGGHAVAVAPALLLAWMLLRPWRLWWSSLLGAAAGFCVALLLTGTSGWHALLLAVGPPLPAVLMAWLMRRGDDAWPPGDLREATLFLLGAGVVLPVLDAAWLAGWSRQLDIATYGHDDLSLLLALCAGHLLLVPVVMGLAHLRRPLAWRRLASGLAVAIALLLLPWLLWQQHSLVPAPSALMTLAAVPLLLWTLLEFGLSGVCAALLALVVLGTRMSHAGLGPFAGLAPPDAVLGMQAWTCATAGALWLIGVLLEQKRLAVRNLREAYRRLSDLAGRVLVVQEEERTRIARDLHDDINQSLAAVSIRMSYLKREVDPAQREAVATIQQDLLRVSNDIRNMSHELHPAVLRFTGIGSALVSLCSNHGARTTLRIHCDAAPPEGLGDECELSLFRIVQEAINNVEKHARAREVWVRLGVEGGQCVLSITDDGIGVNANRRRTPVGLGLISMEERARLLGGQLSVTGTPGSGTRVEVRFGLDRRPGRPQ